MRRAHRSLRHAQVRRPLSHFAEALPRHDRLDRGERIAALLPGVDQRSSDLRVEPNFVVDALPCSAKARSYLFFALVKKLPISRSLGR